MVSTGIVFITFNNPLLSSNNLMGKNYNIWGNQNKRWEPRILDPLVDLPGLQFSWLRIFAWICCFDAELPDDVFRACCLDQWMLASQKDKPSRLSIAHAWGCTYVHMNTTLTTARISWLIPMENGSVSLLSKDVSMSPVFSWWRDAADENRCLGWSPCPQGEKHLSFDA